MTVKNRKVTTGTDVETDVVAKLAAAPWGTGAAAGVSE
jgi:hypothetical protein